MVKIKQKKQLNLPQLIEWAWDNDIKNEIFIADKQRTNIEFDDTGDVLIYGNDNKKTVKFSIEVEEEITEDTELDLIERFIVNNKTYYTNPQTMSINTCLGAAPDDIIITHFYIETDNRELILIWRDGKLVE